MKPLEEALKHLPKPHIKVETFKQNLRHELLKEASVQAEYGRYTERGPGLYWGFLTATLAAATFAATAILFVAIPSLPQRIHQALAGHDAAELVVATESQSPSSAKTQSWDYQAVNLNPGDMQFLENAFTPEDGFDPALLQDEGELVLRRYRDDSGRVILVVTETQPTDLPEDLDERVY